MESKIERRFKRILHKIEPRALCLKLITPGFTGIPDRIIFAPGGKLYIREFKDGNKALSPRQALVIPQLKALGFDVEVIRSDEDTDEFMLLL